MFGTVIRKARLDKTLSLRDVAKLAGITPGHLSRLENDKADGKPAKVTIESLAGCLSLDLD